MAFKWESSHEVIKNKQQNNEDCRSDVWKVISNFEINVMLKFIHFH